MLDLLLSLIINWMFTFSPFYYIHGEYAYDFFILRGSETVNNKERSAMIVNQCIEAFRCPICKETIKVVELKSLVCSNNHTFDFAKQGYVNLLTSSSTSHYDKELFEARKRIIMESNLFSLLHKQIIKVFHEHLPVSNSRTLIFDAGCGEGSHLQKILAQYPSEKVTGVGLDIAKQGVLLAAKNYKDHIWLVGDLANSPLADHSFQVILNILSPSNYKEFKRILVPEGLIVKIVPRSDYLKELREAFFDGTERKSYQNEETVSLFKQHFNLLETHRVIETKKLTQEEMRNLVFMTPLSWNSEKAKVDEFINTGSSEVTVDLDILVGLNKFKKI